MSPVLTNFATAFNRDEGEKVNNTYCNTVAGVSHQEIKCPPIYGYPPTHFETEQMIS